MQTVISYNAFLMVTILLLIAAIVALTLWIGATNDRAYQAGLAEGALIGKPRPNLTLVSPTWPERTGGIYGVNHDGGEMGNSRGNRGVARRAGKPPYGSAMDGKDGLSNGTTADGTEGTAGDGVSTFRRTRMAGAHRAA